jgi:alpha-tubulin suppressor-like RCC1 family protein
LTDASGEHVVSFGELGYGNNEAIGDDETPASVGDINLGGDKVISVAAGDLYTCVLLDGGAVRCWGQAVSGLGSGIEGARPMGETVEQIAAGRFHTCAILKGGSVRCWGENDHGELGYGTASTLGDVDVGAKVTQLALGDGFTCALLEGGRVRCWGEGGPWLGYPYAGDVGEAKAPTIGDDETPAEFGKDVDLGGKAVQIAAGIEHACALLDDGTMRCWGHGAAVGYGCCSDESIGDDETPGSAGPVPVVYVPGM